MKLLLLPLAAFLLGVATTVIASPIDHHQNAQRQPQLVGANECTYGPSYWCYNITNAASCNAFPHCMQTVWTTHTVPEDTDSICKICLDMVQQARDQLLSNTTQEDLKAVFEGSCKLIPLRPIAEMCIHTVDNFIPELVDALSSQMNPQAVCSVAGLCNNARIDKMLAELETQQQQQVVTTIEVHPATAPNRFTCTQCSAIGWIITQKFHSGDRENLLMAALHQCRSLSSLSDGCSSIVLTYFDEMYELFNKHLDGASICHLAGACADRYHQHEGDLARDAGWEKLADKLQMDLYVRSVGRVRESSDNVADDIPCDLCKQLVHHLKDLLIANTTELEFKSVLEGLCKQTGKFKTECLSIVDEYYTTIYTTLLTNLDENEACAVIEICPRGFGIESAVAEPVEIAPLLPALQAQHLYLHITAKPKSSPPRRILVLGDGEPPLTAEQVNRAQLPIDRLLGAPNGAALIENGNLCVVCEYAAHFVQTALASTQTEEEIKAYMKTMCSHVTPKLRAQCDMFVDQYGDALIALAIQQIDPREICPRLFVCPQAQREPAAELLPVVADVAINERREQAAEKCPLCLFAVAQAVAAVKTDRSVHNIQSVLQHLCTELPGKMKTECTDFVATYTPELVRMLADDFTPQAICTNLRLCDEAKPVRPQLDGAAGDVATNEIADATFNGEWVDAISVGGAGPAETTPNCLLCMEVIKQVEKRVTNKKSRAQLKEALEHACAKMPKLEAKCDQLVTRYGDRIVDLLIGEFTPKQLCREIGQCPLGGLAVQFGDGPAVPSAMRGQTQWFVSQLVEASDVALPAQEAVILDRPDMSYVRVNESTLCVLCETVMTQLEEELKDAKTQKQIEDTVKGICHSLPKQYDAECSKFIDQYAKLIIALIDTTPPKQICTQIALCTNGLGAASAVGVVAAEKEVQLAGIALHETKLEVAECAICHAATMALVKVLEDPNVERSVEHVMDRTCNMLPGAYNDRCLAMVEAYGESMLNIIARSSELQTLCTQIGMCHPNEYRSFAQVQMV